MYAAEPGEGGEAWAKVKAKVASAKGTSYINVATEDKVEDGFGFFHNKPNNPRLYDQSGR